MKAIIATVSLIFCCCLDGCSTSTDAFAPVVERSHASVASPGHYRVRAGDTLYSVAWAYGLDYRTLATLNQLSAPYLIHVGQLLRVKRSPSSRPIRKAAGTSVQSTQSQVVHDWRWPASGKVVHGFSEKPLGNKGIDIAGVLHSPVYAAADGIVVYSGAGVRGYGNLIIVKHNQDNLSAYAFNQRNLVRDGDSVRAGQKIAAMGTNDGGQVLLHFEIRCSGEPVDPLSYLP